MFLIALGHETQSTVFTLLGDKTIGYSLVPNNGGSSYYTILEGSKGDLFVARGNLKIWCSQDGAAWQFSRNNMSSYGRVNSSSNKIIVTNNSGLLITEDGINWQEEIIPTYTRFDKFYEVGNKIYVRDQGRYIKIFDNNNWIQAFSLTQEYNGVSDIVGAAYNNGTYWFLEQSQEIGEPDQYGSNIHNKYYSYVSNDGYNFTKHEILDFYDSSITANGSSYKALVFQNNFYLFNNLNGSFYRSSDGINWLSLGSFNADTSSPGMATDGTKVVIIGNNGGLSYYTTDFINLTRIFGFGSSYNTRSVTYVNNRWFIQDNLYTSSDGINWTYANSFSGYQSMSNSTLVNYNSNTNKFFMFAVDSLYYDKIGVWESSTGYSYWTWRPLNGVIPNVAYPNGSARDYVAYNNNVAIFISKNQKDYITSNLLFTSFTQNAYGNTSAYPQITAYNGKNISTGESLYLVAHANGVISRWNESTSDWSTYNYSNDTYYQDGDEYPLSFQYVNGSFILSTWHNNPNNNTRYKNVYVSTDSYSWQRVLNEPGEYDYSGIFYANNNFIFRTNDNYNGLQQNTIYLNISTDGINWRKIFPDFYDINNNVITSNIYQYNEDNIYYKNNFYYYVMYNQYEYNGPAIYKSSDLLNWHYERTLPFSNGGTYISEISNVGSETVMISTGYAGQWYTKDGLNWQTTASTLPLEGYYSSYTLASIPKNTLKEVQISIGNQGSNGTAEVVGPVSVYTVPSGKKTLISSITVTNKTDSQITYDLTIAKNGTKPTQENSHYWDRLLPSNYMDLINGPIVMTAGQSVIVFPSTVDAIEAKVYGAELDA